MKAVLQHGWRATRWVGAGVWSVVVWSSWLALLGLLGLQLWWFRSSELAVPGFVLRALETRLAASNLHATFGRTVFDPTGRVILEDLKLSTPEFREPIATARLIYVHLDPWALATGAFEPEEIQLSGVSLYEPAMLSASGRPEPVVSNLEATVALRPRELEVRQLHTRVGGIGIAATGTIPIPAWQQQRNAPLPVADFLAHDYPRLSHEIATQLRQLEGLEEAEVRLTLTPSDVHGVIVEARMLAAKVPLTRPFALVARGVSVFTRFPVGGTTVAKVQLEAQADELALPDGTVIASPHGRIRGSANLTPGAWGYTPDEFEAAARAITSPLLPHPLGSTYAVSRSLTPRLSGLISTELAGTAVFADASADLGQQSADVTLDSRVGPALLSAVAQSIKRDLGRWVSLTRPVDLTARLRLDPSWKLTSATAVVDGEDLTAYGVPLDEARGRITLNGSALAATEVVVRTGPSLAAGSYTMDTASRDFRFLLEGRLVPAAISPWFRSGWWDRLFSHFDFTAAVPAANVDVTGRWGVPERTQVYISVLADGPAIEGVPLDRVRTVLFVRSLYYEARELAVRHRGGSGRGTFAVWTDPATRQTGRIDFQGQTTGLDPGELLAMLGDTGRRIAAPFRFQVAPDLKVEGRLDNVPGPAGMRPSLRVQGSSPGVVQVYEFPVSNLRFTADVNDADIAIVPEADFGGGKGTGRVWLAGRGPEQTMRLEYALKGAKLGPTAEALEAYGARDRVTPRAEKSSYLTKASDVNVNVTLVAEGPAGNPYGLKGRGTAELEGARLGEVPLLGPLSELLPVLSLRFTRMQSDLELNGPLLRMPNVRLTGANSSVDAVGTYNLQNRGLDYNVKAYPFSESSNPLLLPFNLITRPLSELFEMHLGGTLDKPSWSVGATTTAREPARTEPVPANGAEPAVVSPAPAVPSPANAP
jgi:hypothetical protein